MAVIQLLGYAPDADPTIVGVLTNCSAAVPSLKGMKGAPAPASTPLATLAATCQGAAVISKLDSSTRFFAGTGTKLYEAGASIWSDVSRAAAYTANSTNRWRYAQFGDTTLAANGADTIQASVGSGAFSCVAGAPAAAIVETVGAFVFAFNTPAAQHGWQCAGINTYTNWVNSVAAQAASGTLTASPAPITAGKRFGSAIVAYKRNSMYLGTYVGPPNIWEFNQIPGSAGAMSNEAVVNIGIPDDPKHIFMGEDDFYLYDGAKPVPIGTNRVKNAVFGAILTTRFYACSALHDKVNNLVYFFYPVADSPNPDHCVVYNYRTDKWGVDDRQVEATVEYITPGITYDSLGGQFATYNDIAALPYNLAFLSSSKSLPGIFDTTHTVKTLTGPATSSSITTGDYGDDLSFSTLRRVKPRFLTAPTSATMTNYYKNAEGDSLTTDQVTTMSSGQFDVLRDARWHRVLISMSGDWEMSSIAADVIPASDE